MFKLTKNVVTASLNLYRSRAASMSTQNIKFETLSVTVPKPFVYHVELNRPDKRNAMNCTMWSEIKDCFEALNTDEDCRVVILTGAGKLFSAGLDLQDATKRAEQFTEIADIARRAKPMEKILRLYQGSISSLEICRKPVLAGIHSACIGGGSHLITAADIRYCTKDAWFQIEIFLGLAPDVGLLQRLPKVVGSDSLARELCYTGRKLTADEAYRIGLVSRVLDDKESMLSELLKTAEEIAAKSPVAVQGTKSNIIYSRDHTVQEGLERMIIWNQLNIQSEDFATALVALATKQKDVVFSKL